MATRAFIEGVTKGRNGKGSIFIWASGNGGRERDNCNCDGYTNSIWTLSISSATEDGLVPWYSEMCSSTLATTYSSGGQGEKQVVTTDLHHSCTASHTGTSASAPLAAGIAALVLEANSNLTWRDLQHIVVRTAKPSNLKDPSWSKNGVGRRVSHSFGYGLMDAVAMVRLARTWKTVPDQQRCEINAPHLDRQIPPKSRLKLQLTVQHCKGVNFLEHVQAKITLTSSRRGDIQIYLTSPAGTKVTLLTSRSHDVSRAGFNNWPFMSVHTWGEAPHGHWQLEIFNEGRYMGYTMFKGWSIILYGTSTPAQVGDPLVVSKMPSSPLPTPFNSITNNNSYNYGSFYTKAPSNVNNGKNNNNKKQQQFGYTPSYTGVSPSRGGGGSGKGNKNKNKNKNKNSTTVRPNLSQSVNSYNNNNNKNRVTTTMTTSKPRTTIGWNSLSNSWGKQQSLSVIPQKTAVKAPKQVKSNNESPPESPTVISRTLNLFDHYDKIQQIFPELQPYQDTTNSMSSYNTNNKNNNNNFDMTTAKTPLSSSIVVVNNKPSRANSKIVFDPNLSSSSSSSNINNNNPEPDVEFIDAAEFANIAGNNNSKKNNNNKGSSSSWSTNNMRGQNSRISSSQRNGKAQITQWELIFYGTEDPPQPDDPPRYGFDKSGLDSETYDGEINQNVLEFEPGTAGQWRDIQQVDGNRIDVSQRTASSISTACRNLTHDSTCIGLCFILLYLLSSLLLSQNFNSNYNTNNSLLLLKNYQYVNR
uniref:CSON007967 protein n=2 Tax=Culicoides sonorensis TaxID=179676 RepID=A0A336LB42_CULSO